MFRAWREGDVLATVGTGSLTPAEEKEFGLVGEHNYSIFGLAQKILDNMHGYGTNSGIDIRMQETHRLLQIRNPWSKRGIPKQTFHAESPFEDDLTHGTFWLEYHTLGQSFKTLYLNWNPRLFGFAAQRHFQFTPAGGDFDVGGNGQFVVTVEESGVVWLLVERHYLGSSEGWEGYIGLALFCGEERIYSYTRPVTRVPPSTLFHRNHPCCLCCGTKCRVDGIRRFELHTIENSINTSSQTPHNPNPRKR